MSLEAEAPQRCEEREEVIEAVVSFMLVPSSVAFYEALGRVHTSSLFSRRQTAGFGELGEISYAASSDVGLVSINVL